MQYLISFLEGIITFVSPCLLPMLPIYVSYFAGGQRSMRKTLTGALGFVLGFTMVFVAMGALAGTVGGFLKSHQTAVNLVSGVVVILFGLNFLGVLRVQLFRGGMAGGTAVRTPGFFSSVLFGLIFSLGWTPCVGAFLGSALLLAFVASALLIDELKSAFDWIKRHYTVINRISGGFLVLVGLLMATGLLGRMLALLS